MNLPTSGGTETDLPLREQLSNLQALLALSMRMTDSEDEEKILRLAGTAVPSLARCRLVGAYLADDGWHATKASAADAQLRAEVEMQLAVVSTAGGAIAVGREEWGWAFPLRSLGRHFGFLAVTGADEPSPAEQFLLRVLAQQTGVALANARLHTQQRRQATELLDINSRLADTVAALERSTAIHDRLTRVAVAGEGQEGIAEAVHELTGFAVAVEDRYGNPRAWAGPDRPDPYPKESPDDREAVVRRALDAAGPIRHGGRLLVVAHPREDVVGILALVDPDEKAGDDAQVAIEHGATVLAMELARLSGIAETELRLRRDLVDELLAGTDEASAIARAEALGYDLERPHRVVVVKAGPHADRHELFHAVRRAARDCGVGTLLATRGQSVVVLADTDRPWEVFRSTVGRELRGGGYRVGVGGLCDRCRRPPSLPPRGRAGVAGAGGGRWRPRDRLRRARRVPAARRHRRPRRRRPVRAHVARRPPRVRRQQGGIRTRHDAGGVSRLRRQLRRHRACALGASQHAEVPPAADPRDLRPRPRLARGAVQPAARRAGLADRSRGTRRIGVRLGFRPTAQHAVSPNRRRPGFGDTEPVRLLRSTTSERDVTEGAAVEAGTHGDASVRALRLRRAPPRRTDFAGIPPARRSPLRPGAGGRPPRSPGFGLPCPDAGYALLLADLAEDYVVLELVERRQDAEWAIAIVAMRRAGALGRAPIIEDLEIARTCWRTMGAGLPTSPAGGLAAWPARPRPGSPSAPGRCRHPRRRAPALCRSRRRRQLAGDATPAHGGRPRDHVMVPPHDERDSVSAGRERPRRNPRRADPSGHEVDHGGRRTLRHDLQAEQSQTKLIEQKNHT